MRVAPASHDAHTRRPSRKRPKNTALGPWTSKNGSPDAQHLLALALEGAGPLEQPAPALAPDHVADVVADDRGGGGERDHELDLELALAGEHGGGDQRGLAGDGQPAGLAHDEQEQQRVAGDFDEVVDVEERGEHRRAGSRPGVRRGRAPGSYLVFSETSCCRAEEACCTSE